MIVATRKDLTKRYKAVRKIIEPLRKSLPTIAIVPKTSSTVWRIFAHDGVQTTSNSRDIRFRTQFDSIRARYFEIWVPKASDWVLTQAYLDLFQLDSEHEFQKLLSLHCDPNEPASESYKRGPHLHLQAAGPPLCTGHIALGCQFTCRILESSKDLTEALQWASEMIATEVLVDFH